MTEQKLTGYPSIDRPWLKYYPDEVISSNVPKKSMFDMIYDSNKDFKDNVAIIYLNRKITYGEMFANINKLAAALLERGIKKGDIVSIISLNTPETIYCIYALNLVGAVGNLILASNTSQDILSNLKETDSKLVFILDKILDKLQEFDCSIPVVILSLADSAGCPAKLFLKSTVKRDSKFELYKSFLSSDNMHIGRSDASADSPAIIVYTSGSTGTPKGVVLTNHNLNAVAYMCSVSGKNYKHGEKFLNILPPFFSFGIGMLHLCLYTGMTEVSMLIPKTEQIQKNIKKYRPERFVMGPVFADVIEKFSVKDLSFLIDLTGGGASISAEREMSLNSVLQSKNAASKYLAGYGMTELASAVSMNHNNLCKEQSVGVALPYVNIKIIDLEDGRELSYNEVGELLVSSPGLMASYFNMPEETDKTIEIIDGQRWIHTGDLAKIDEDGFIFITGRIKRIYVVKANDGTVYRLFPQRLEELVEAVDVINKCGVIVVEDKVKEHMPIVFITINGNADKETVKARVEDVISSELPEYYAPKDIIVLDEMPINTSQKIDYQKLEQIWMKELDKSR